MQLESLKVFLDVVRLQSFSQAARAHELTQSAVSQIVAQLEDRLGVDLFIRFPRPLRLTELGKLYHDGCRGFVEQYLELEASIRQEQSELAAYVRVAAIYSVGLGDMGLYVERFKAEEPNVRVHVEYVHPDKVYEKVLDGTADFGLVSFPRKSRELAALSWRDESMVLACPPNHRLAGRESVKPADLAGEKYIGFDKALVIRREVDRFLREHGVAVEVTTEFDNIDSIKKAVEISAGIALLPEPTLRREVEGGTLVAVPLQDCRFVRPLGIIQHRHRKLSSTARRFLELLCPSNGHASASAGTLLSAGVVRPHTRRNGAARSRNGAPKDKLKSTK